MRLFCSPQCSSIVRFDWREHIGIVHEFINPFCPLKARYDWNQPKTEQRVGPLSGVCFRGTFRGREFQPSATSPLFFDNLHFEHFDKSVHLDSLLTFLSKCSKWRLSKKRGLVADGW